MRGLIQKDFYVMRERIRPINYIIIAIAVLAVMIYFQSIGTMYIAILLPMLLVGAPKTIMMYDTQCKWDKLAIALPVTRKRIILSRYLFSAILTFFMSLISFGLCMVATMFFEDFTIALCVKFSSLGFVLALFYGLLTIPSGYAMGDNGGSFTMMFSVVLFLAVAYLLKKMNIDMENIMLRIANYAGFISVIGLVVIGAVSYTISVHFYTKRHS